MTSKTSPLSTFATSKASNTVGVSSSTVIGDGLSSPSPIQTGMTNICYSYQLVASGDTCAAIASDADIALTDFYSWNPAVGTDCANVDIGDYVCIKILGYGISVSAVATASLDSSKAVATSATSSTSTGDGIATPSPIQTGMAATCDAFYLVVSGDSCSAIETSQGISLTNFYAWNPAVGTSCAYLGLGDYVCVGIVGYTATTTTTTATTTTTTSTGNGITTPTSVQTGIVSDCNTFYYVVSGDGCSSIATSQGVTVAEIEAWNPAIGTDCTSLWLETYICIGVV
ncbi:uncharacterized protein N7529_001331 [Penicillium soppii]|uniref:uncharacterized protein n=1 Tax=Penicillium soppii TaxID=69789 RepID=UPI0025473F33|nr:uncharacterized protein N7529_001331 [Penicillium soppii]KAJ5882659.1 hypothetical protein N7529_001331 [Penicillium soppii]